MITLQLLHCLAGHDGPAESVLWSASGDRFFSGGTKDGSAYCWSAKTYRQLQSYKGHEGWIRAIAYDTEEHVLFTAADEESVIRVWDALSGKLIAQSPGHENSIDALEFNTKHKLLVSGSSDHSFALWQQEKKSTLRLIQRTEVQSQVTSVTFSPDGRVLGVGLADGMLCIYGVDSGRVHHLGSHDTGNRINTIKFLGGSGQVAVGLADATIELYDLIPLSKSGELLGHTAQINSLCYAEQFQTLLSASSDDTIRMWDIRLGIGETAISVESHGWSGIQSLGLSPDESTLITAADEPCAVGVWSLAPRIA